VLAMVIDTNAGGIPIVPMHEEKLLGNTPKIPIASFWFYFSKWVFPKICSSCTIRPI